jgi:hypothetical protein
MAAREVAKVVIKTVVDTIKVVAVLDPSGVVEASADRGPPSVQCTRPTGRTSLSDQLRWTALQKSINMLASIPETLQQEAGSSTDLPSKPIIDNIENVLRVADSSERPNDRKPLRRCSSAALSRYAAD